MYEVLGLHSRRPKVTCDDYDTLCEFDPLSILILGLPLV